MIDREARWHPRGMRRCPVFSRLSLALLVSTFGLAACSEDDSSVLAGDDEGSYGEDGALTGGTSGGDGDGGVGTSDSGTGTSSGGDSGASSGGDDGGGDSGGGTDGGDSGGDGDGDGDVEPIPPGQLTAGEWRDLDHWDFWLGLVGEGGDWTTMVSQWSLDTARRYPVVVLDGEGRPAVDVAVDLVNDTGAVWSARTDVDGRAETFAGMFDGIAAGGLRLEARAEDAVAIVEDPTMGGGDPNVMRFQQPVAAPAKSLDLMFVVDTTGSMGDELYYLQAELDDVIRRVLERNGQELQLRVSMNFYRDVGDEYVVRDFPFTSASMAISQLAAQSYDGGGDYPEALDRALDNGVLEHDWSDRATSRLLFLVADAPPHTSSNETVPRLQTATSAAAEQGIRIVPVAASGVNKDTEFLMRMADVATGGTYVFLTDDSGIGNGHLEPTIGDYEVELLNDLMVRVIDDSLQ